MKCEKSGREIDSGVLNVRNHRVYDAEYALEFVGAHGVDPIDGTPVLPSELVPVTADNYLSHEEQRNVEAALKCASDFIAKSVRSAQIHTADMARLLAENHQAREELAACHATIQRLQDELAANNRDAYVQELQRQHELELAKLNAGFEEQEKTAVAEACARERRKCFAVFKAQVQMAESDEESEDEVSEDPQQAAGIMPPPIASS